MLSNWPIYDELMGETVTMLAWRSPIIDGNRTITRMVPLGGCYRLIDIPMSNCINSGINKIYILTQFNSQSLNRHIARTYNFSNGVHFGDGFVEVLAATQTPGKYGNRWFQGNAVRQFISILEVCDQISPSTPVASKPSSKSATAILVDVLSHLTIQALIGTDGRSPAIDVRALAETRTNARFQAAASRAVTTSLGPRAPPFGDGVRRRLHHHELVPHEAAEAMVKLRKLVFFRRRGPSPSWVSNTTAALAVAGCSLMKLRRRW
ncbi:hypothetical protein QJS10_CPA03g02388 [Acorus calamus]|uniref:Nucleotidyl transferase domain-containing protein n=1 Tax=Acorus calamus TaxID=4465 RepID=A0AAV9F5P3_ACOCL|nr:hypothetical protein QJS10_CPA03g02388 [Acorus calamus]